MDTPKVNAANPTANAPSTAGQPSGAAPSPDHRTGNAPPETDGLPVPQRHWVMLCLVLGVALSTLDSAIANIALPTIARELAASNAATIWVVNGYQLAAAVCLLPAASLGEILGHKRVYAVRPDRLHHRLACLRDVAWFGQRWSRRGWRRVRAAPACLPSARR